MARAHTLARAWHSKNKRHVGFPERGGRDFFLCIRALRALVVVVSLSERSRFKNNDDENEFYRIELIFHN